MRDEPRVRCAIYTRKSSEEGLGQAFNSLHAQREYCEAYIKSQGGEGWRAVRQRYEDGGFSGASLTRPGLQRLLADIEAKRIDAVVVYKVDRLTRSLADFARILERLDKNGAAFVSVTQAFNTNSSMGRLTLNVLLSFAQFERDVTGERIRDKIAASKAKGMWMGGVVPLGYDPPDASGDRRLRVNEAEAATVRTIFQRLIHCRSFYDLPKFVRQKKRFYSYYVAPPLMPGLADATGSDALRRVPCQAMDDLIRRRLGDLLASNLEALTTNAMREIVDRVEVHGDCVQIVLHLAALGVLDHGLRDRGAMEARLRPGERVLPEASRLGRMRISLPVRMKLRGGRTWLKGQDPETATKAKATRLATLKRLRAAHDAFAPTRSALDPRRQRIRAATPPVGGMAGVGWVFLDPGIQSAILNGRLSSETILRLEMQSEIPLSWAAQRRLLEPVCA